MKNPNRTFKDSIYEQFARIGKAVSSPKRLELLDLLCQGKQSVETLAKKAEMSVGNTSQHLQVLRSARLVEVQKNGVFIFYRFADQKVCEFFRSMRILAEKRLTEVEYITKKFLDGKEKMEPIDRNTLINRAKEGTVIVLDVRPMDEYCAGHIPGSLSIPLKELKKRLSELPNDQAIVAYCRGPYCVLAIQAVEMLRGKGFHAVRFEDSIQDWRAQGLPVAVGENE